MKKQAENKQIRMSSSGAWASSENLSRVKAFVTCFVKDRKPIFFLEGFCLTCRINLIEFRGNIYAAQVVKFLVKISCHASLWTVRCSYESFHFLFKIA